MSLFRQRLRWLGIGGTAVAAVVALLTGAVVTSSASTNGAADKASGGAVDQTADRADPFTVYMAPEDKDGDDANDGLRPASAVKTLVRVQEVLRQHDPETDVEVRIDQGTYVAQSTWEWRYYVPGHTISFLPIDYEYGDGLGDIAGRPVFRNAECGDTYCPGFWLQPRLPTDSADPMYDGGDSRLRFYYLQVENYPAGGVDIHGDTDRDIEDETYSPPLRVKGSKGLNRNTFAGMRFRNIGSKWAGGDYGYGAIVLTNSSNNVITNSHFGNIENASGYEGYIHGVYITHFSSHNQVRNNSFSYISGDPVKDRNLSNYNTVEHNTFTRTGQESYYRGEFCDQACAVEHDLARQCASYGNKFFDNRLVSSYDGGQLWSWSLGPEGLTHAGEEPCSIPDGEQRIYTGGNDDSATP